jgi:hypothetical protein
MRVGDKNLVSVPYSYAINDKQALEAAHLTTKEFRDIICDQFGDEDDVRRRVGGTVR